MSTKIRLSRGGTHNKPYYRVVVTNSRSPRDSKHIENIGTYNPLVEESKRFTVDADRVRHWLGLGAQMSPRMHLLLNKAGVVETKPRERAHRKPRKDQPEAAAPAAAAPTAEAPAAEAPKEAPAAEATA